MKILLDVKLMIILQDITNDSYGEILTRNVTHIFISMKYELLRHQPLDEDGKRY